jgi:thioesterase domain-containing protein
MTPSAFQTYLYTHIPLSRAMEVEVLEADANGVLIEAPLAPNINMHGTMFGGSVATLALLSAWSIAHLALESQGLAVQLVIHRSDIEYIRPVEGRAQAFARPVDLDWSKFMQAYERRGRARLNATTDVLFNGETAARFSGEFVALAAT